MAKKTESEMTYGAWLPVAKKWAPLSDRFLVVELNTLTPRQERMLKNSLKIFSRANNARGKKASLTATGEK